MLICPHYAHIVLAGEAGSEQIRAVSHRHLRITRVSGAEKAFDVCFCFINPLAMDLLDSGSRGGATLATALASCSLLLLLLLRSFLLHTPHDFSALAQLLLLQLGVQAVVVAAVSSRNSRRLRVEPQRATLDAVHRLASLFLTVQALRHFGVLFAFLVQHVDLLLLQLERWHATGDKESALLLLIGYLLVAGIHSDAYGTLLHTLTLLGAALGLRVAVQSLSISSAPHAQDDASPQTLLSVTMAMSVAAVLALLTPVESDADRVQQLMNDRVSGDAGSSMTTWTAVSLMGATASHFAGRYVEQKLTLLSSIHQAKAQLVCTSTGIVLAIGVALGQQQWLHAALSVMACSLILFVFVREWHRAGASFGDGGGHNGDDSEAGLDTYRPSPGCSSKEGVLAGASHVIGVLWSRRASRQMLLFLSVNVAFMFVELGVGLYTNSLGLMGDAGHMLFDNGALTIGLVASYIGQLPPDAKFTYGYGRVEVLSGFLNSLLLLVVSFHLLTEAASRFMDPPEVTTDHLLLTSTVGLFVNLVGLFFFHDHVHGNCHSHGGDSTHGGGCGIGHGHSHGGDHHQAHSGHASEGGHDSGNSNSNMYGVYLHVLADTMGSVGVIISSVLIEMFGWHVADSASSALISLLILGSTLPLLQNTALQLLQGAPQELKSNVDAALLDVQTMVPGVERIARWNIWHHAGSMSVATLHLEVASSADEQHVLQHTRDIFRRHARLDEFLTVQVSKPQVTRTMGAERNGSERSQFTNGYDGDHAYSRHHDHGHSHGYDNDHSHRHSYGHSHGHSHSHDQAHDPGHGHRHGDGPSADAHSAFSVHHQHAQPVANAMDMHKNPARDDSCNVILPKRASKNPGMPSCGHGFESDPTSARPAPFASYFVDHQQHH
uniref:Cation efflux protein transmembrane domain-containing protein n=1 Tax=Peronospora matthiolae TaxID=2874970 RepID=A0AAV1T3H1_9STRA